MEQRVRKPTIIAPHFSIFHNGTFLIVLCMKNFKSQETRNLFNDIKRITISPNYDEIEKSRITLDGKVNEDFYLIQKITKKNTLNFSLRFQGVHCGFNELDLEQQSDIIGGIKTKAVGCIAQEDVIDGGMLKTVMRSFLKAENKEEVHFELLENENFKEILNGQNNV